MDKQLDKLKCKKNVKTIFQTYIQIDIKIVRRSESLDLYTLVSTVTNEHMCTLLNSIEPRTRKNVLT